MQNEKKLNDIGGALLRLIVGGTLVSHSFVKIFVFTMPGTVEFFKTLGYPGFMAYVVMLSQLILGSLIVLGFKTRILLPLFIPFFLGVIKAHWAEGWLKGWQFPLFWLITSTSLWLIGSGEYSLDKCLEKRKK